MMTGAEQLRLSFLGEPAQLALAAGDDEPHQAAQAAATLGLDPRAEHEAEPACDWCGRSNPPGGLEDQSLGGPASHECNRTADCQSARDRRLPMWMDKQFHWWRVDWDKYNRMLAYQQEQAARTRYGGGIYALTADPLDLAALAMVRDMVEAKAARAAPGMRELLELTAQRQETQGIPDPATPNALARPGQDRPVGPHAAESGPPRPPARQTAAAAGRHRRGGGTGPEASSRFRDQGTAGQHGAASWQIATPPPAVR